MAEVVHEVEVRCPVGPRKLFTKLRLGEGSARYVPSDNTIELACSDCSRRLTRETGTAVRVLHRYNFIGELVESLTRPG